MNCINLIKMIVIDGSYGEGGGQILRTSVALSALTNTPIKIINIRKKRQNPGLQAQHISAIKAVGMLCNAKINGLYINSTEIEFYPEKIYDKKFKIDIGTAGSIPLVLQALMIASINNNVEIEITGGTDVKFAPSIDYVKFVTIPILKMIGMNADIEVLKRGYYPKGGGMVKAVIKKSNIRGVNFVEKGKICKIYGISHSSSILKGKNVAERQKNAAEKFLKENLNFDVKIEEEYGNALCAGSGITLIGKTEKSIIGVCSLGEPGKKAEDVGIECAKKLMEEIKSDNGLDSHMGDQIIPYIAIGKGKAKIKITNHAETNIHTVNLFGFNVRENNGIVECI